MNTQKYIHALLIFSFFCLVAREASAADIATFLDVNGTANQVLESAGAGVPVGVTAKATGIGSMSYTMNDDAAGRFQVDLTTGVVTTTGSLVSPLDRETDTTHRIKILATTDAASGDTDLLTIDVTVLDVDDNPTSAISDKDNGINEVSENAGSGKLINIQALATDADDTAVISYALSADAGGRFQIDGTGKVSTTGVLIDREAAAEYVITVQANSTMGASKFQDFTIAVLGVDEFDPVAVADVYSVAEGGTLVTTATRAGDGVLRNDTDDDRPFEALKTTRGTDVGVGTLNLNNGGDFTYTHDGTEVFADSFTYKVSDPNFTTGFVMVTLNILPVNDNIPVALDDSYLLLINEGGTLNGASVLANDSDADLPGDTLTAVLDTDVSNGTLALASDGTFTYTHDGATEIFSDSFTYHVFDGVNTTGNIATVTLTVNPVDDNSPVAGDDSYALLISEGGTLNGTTVLVNDTDADLPGDTLTAVLDTDVSNGSLLLAPNGTFTYTHNGATEALTDSFTYHAFDGTNTDGNIATATITVNPVNDNVPVAVDDDYLLLISEGATLNGTTVLANDTDLDLPGDTLTAVLDTDVSNGTLALASDGTFTYTHDGASEIFADSFTYHMFDGVNATGNIATVSLTVNPSNDNVPVAVDDNYLLLINEGGTLNGTTVLVNDTDLDLPGDTLTAVLDTDVSNGTLALASDGTFTYTHDGASEILSDSFTYHMFDGVNATGNIATVTLSVNPVNDNKPVAVADATYVVDEGATLSVAAVTGVLNNDTDADLLVNGSAMNTLTVVNGTSTTYGLLTLNADGSFTYAHDDSENFSDSFTYQVFDGTYTSDNVVTVNITVTPVNDNVPVISSGPSNSINENDTVALTVQATDVDTTDTLAFSIVGGDDALKFAVTANTGVASVTSVLSFLSAPDYEVPTDIGGDNVYVVDVQVSDGLQTATQTISITVLPLSDTAPTSSDRTIAANEDAVYGFSSADFAFSDADLDGFDGILLASLPALGDLALSGVAVSPGDFIAKAQFGTLTYMPDPDDDGISYSNFDFSVRDASFMQSATTNTITIDVAGVADVPALTTAAGVTTDEDQAIDIGLAVGLTDGTRENLTVVVGVSPAGATLSDGTNSATAASIDISSWNLNQISLTSVLHDDTDIVLSIVATATEVGNGDTATASGTTNVTVTAVADAPSLAVTSPVTVAEDGTVGLTLAGLLVDTDGSETISYQLSGMPVGASLNQGTNVGAGIWNLAVADLAGLSVAPPANSAQDFTLSATALSTEVNDGGAPANSGLQSIVVIVDGVADMPVVGASTPVVTSEDVATSVLGITAGLTDPAEESLSVSIQGVPPGATLTDGLNTVISAGATIDVTGWLLGDIYLVPPLHANGLYTLTVNATAKEDENTSTQTASTDIDLTVAPINDAPVVADQGFATDENTSVGTVVGTVLASDVDTGQTLSYGVTGSAFAIDSNGVITVADPAQLDYETTTTFNLTVTVTDDGVPVLFDTAALVITLNPLNDNAPVGGTDAVAVDEQSAVSFNVLDNDVEPDLLPTAPLTVTEVNGDMGLVGVAFPLEVGGVAAGMLTISADGTAIFVASADPTVELFSVSADYTVSDGTLVDAGVPVTLTINPINDNAPVVSAAGLDLAAQGLNYNEDDRLTAASGMFINLQTLFTDLDIGDSLQFNINSNSNATVVPASINASDYLVIYSPDNEFGIADLVLEATDTADPSTSISTVSLGLRVTVDSVNDAPIYQADSYSNIVVNEDSGALTIDLAGAFTDLDMLDSDGSDDSLVYQITLEDIPDEYMLTNILEMPATNITIISDAHLFTATVPPIETSTRVVVLETTEPSIQFGLVADAHGLVNVSIRATDLGLPPFSPAAAAPLYDEHAFTITVNAIGDDQPMAVDDHYSTNISLVMSEDGDPILLDLVQNDYQGDMPATIISAGQEIIDSFGGIHRWRTTSRLADLNNTGDFSIFANGEVGCASVDCQTTETPDTTIDASILDGFSVFYRPSQNFNGEDSFTYCIEDDAPGTDSPTCALVTVNVLPVNDLPEAMDPIIFVMQQADDLIVLAADGLKTKVFDVDNTHRDGFGCNPLDPLCVPGVDDPQPDTLHFFANTLPEHGDLVMTGDDGSFTYRPSASFTGEDTFLFDVCDALPASADNCLYGLTAFLVIEPIASAPEGSTDGAVQFDYQLANSPLELPVGPEPNVLLINDDSGSMAWDISTSQTNGIYNLSSRYSIRYVMKASAGDNTTYIAPSEEVSPNQGFWRLRNAKYNLTYYDSEIQYLPWAGLDNNGNEYPDSTPTNAKHHPVIERGTTNITIPQRYRGRALGNSSNCVEVCISRRGNNGICLIYEPKCSNTGGLNRVWVDDYYIPRYYVWDDKNLNGQLDSTPSPKFGDKLRYVMDVNDAPVPASGSSSAEGRQVEIKRASDGGSDYYPKAADRTDCNTMENACTFAEELQNFSNWFTYGRTRESTAKAALGQVVATAENIRVGYAKLNDSDGQQRIKLLNTSERTGAKADLLDSIYQTTSVGGTPLRRALQGAGRYFACKGNDIFGSSTSWDTRKGDCPILPAPEGNCQQNFALLITDGTWNGWAPSGVDDEDGDENSSFDGGAFASGRTSDETLADVAMYYYENDLSDLKNEVPTTSRDRAQASPTAFENSDNLVMHQHMSTYTVGFGVRGAVETMPIDYTASFEWGDPYNSTPAKTDDVRHAAYNGRGEYLDVTNVKDMSAALVRSFEEFSQGSGAASAVSFNSQEVQEGTLIFRAFYNTKTNIGNLIAQSLTLDGLVEEPVWESAETLDAVAATDREIITLDRINNIGIPFRGDVGTLLNADQQSVFVSPCTGTTAFCDAQRNTELTQRVNYLRGDRSLERPVGNFRERPGERGRLGDIVHSTPVFVGGPSRLGRDASPYPQGDLDRYSVFRNTYSDRVDAIYVAANDGMLHSFNSANGEELFAYVPDNLMTGVFSERITELLNFEYSHRFFVDLTPALNDVFMDADGDLFREWRTLLVGGHGAGAKAYFALDVTDSDNFDEAHADDIALWEFTDADDSYPTDSNGNPLRDNNTVNGDGSINQDGTQKRDLQATPQPVKDLGYSFSVPTLAMSNVVTNGEHEWVAMFGNGFNSTAGIAKLFLLFVDRGVDGTWCHPDMQHNVVLNGAMPTECVDVTDPLNPWSRQDFVKIDTGFGVAGGYPNGLGTPRGIDADGNGTLDYAYAGDTFGNVFRFDMTSSNYADWSVTRIFVAEYTDVNSVVTPQQVTTQPVVTSHPTEAEGYMVIFGTGSYVTVPDGSSTDIQSIYGLWDRPGAGEISRDKLVQQVYTNEVDVDYGNVRTLSANPVDYSVTGGKKGWHIDLNPVAAGDTEGIDPPEFPGERANRNIQIRGGLAFVNSIVPRGEDSCINVAGGFALTFCPGTGGSACFGGNGVFDLNGDGDFSEKDNVDKDAFGLNGRAAAGLRFENAVPTDSSFIGDKRITQLSDKSINIVGTNTNRGLNTGRLSWKQLDAVD